MELDLKGKRAFVSGSSSGIGTAIAVALAKEGAAVVVHGRDRRRADDVATKIRQSGGVAHVAIGDLATDAGAEQAAAEGAKALGGVDILVNVAGGPGGPWSWESTTPAMWMDQFQMNTISAVRLIRAFLPGMKAQHWGRVISISSVASRHPLPDQVPAYCASKDAIISFNANLALTVAGDGITANVVTPGFILTDALKEYFIGLPVNANKSWEEIEAATAAYLGIATGRFGRVHEIANLVTYVSSPLAAYINGSNLRADGCTVHYAD